MTVHSDDKGYSPADHLWAEFGVMAAVIMIAIVLSWRYVF
jgi:hypothetical protein